MYLTEEATSTKSEKYDKRTYKESAFLLFCANKTALTN